jgi:hypothetical protein
MTTEQKSFIEKIGKYAQADYTSHKILPSLTIAQAILESSWGKSGLTKNAKNLFGMKAGSSWKGKVYVAETKEEYVKGKVTVITSNFRKYSTLKDSVVDHGELLQASRYSKVKGESDYKKACKYIYEAGYATDSKYTNQLITLIEMYNLDSYDTVAKKTTSTSKTSTTSTTKAVYGKVVTNSTVLNLRKEPSTNSEILAKIPKGKQVLIKQQNYKKGWHKIKYGGNLGYAAVEYIKILS